jgi:polyhydroxyalkanoate synthesis regulator phasin
VNESLRKLLMAGLGAIDLTHEKAMALFDDLVKRGELNEPEAKELLANWSKRAFEQRDKIQQQVDEAVQKGLKTVGYVKATEVDALKARLEELERKLAGE